ncbi:MAG: MBL fold metallo-hydrolase [Bryobacter sp.]|nr:MBL fold metallo-hydrolase [Bryobacter sp.]
MQRIVLFRSLALVAALSLLKLYSQVPQPDGAGVEPGVLPKAWITGGPKCMEVPEWQIHEYNADLYILRESGCTHYEKPFLYVVFGNDKVTLIDTGAGKVDSLPAVYEGVVSKWLARKGKTDIARMVIHTHGHGDHIAGDKLFQNKPGIEFVPFEIPAIQKAFGIAQWPDSVGKLDLGGRVLDVVPIPGHHSTDVAFYDARTGLLLIGDTLYPGRLYVTYWDQFVKSVDRIVQFTEGKVVTHILGCHIEQSDTPYLEFPIGSIYQPREHALELSRGHLLELQAGLRSIGTTPRRLAFRDFTIWPLNPEVLREMRRVRQETEERLRKTQWAQPQ